MLNLFPVRYLIVAALALSALTELAAANFGIFGVNCTISDIKTIVNYSMSGSLVFIALCAALWRWLKPIQTVTFPYLGGIWEGDLTFSKEGVSINKPIKMTINHNLMNIMMILDSDESTSRTLTVHEIKDKGIEMDKIYYVYLNERKEGVAGAGDRYRGVWIMRCNLGKRSILHGDYFTEQRRGGTLELSRIKPHQWWKLWK